jgi:predicted sulfurtransferase
MGRFLNIVFFVLAVLVWTTSASEEAVKEAEQAVQKEAERGNYQDIDIDGLWELYQNSERDVLLIDTRQDWEFRTGSIAGAINFPMESTWFSRLIQRGSLTQALGPDKERTLVFY